MRVETYKADDIFGQFRRSMRFSTCLPPFRNFISVIIEVCPEEKMRRSFARRIIAVMTHVESFWNRSVGQKPGVPMRQDFCARLVESENAVSGSVLLTRPHPALAGLLDIRPESFMNGLRDWTRLFLNRVHRGHIMQEYHV